ncbi:hypothetical protein [Actinosynnema sp. NPDC020468]|uniref:hypothetical protein n=1 Tax=Actinosynnema sp. NPDC020468 TaxID=3154488 RepID=UPI0033FF1711
MRHDRQRRHHQRAEEARREGDVAHHGVDPATTDPAPAALVLRHGRHTTGPLIESSLAVDGTPDPLAAFRLRYGLVIADHRIRTTTRRSPRTTTSGS